MADTPFATLRRFRRTPRVSEALPAVSPPRWSALAGVLSSAVLSTLLFVFFQRGAFEPIWRLAATASSGPEPWLLPLMLVSTSLISFLPGVLVAAFLGALGRPRASQRAFVVASSLALLLALVDLDLLGSVGRHLSELVTIAWQPHGHVAAGDRSGWVLASAKWCVLSVLGTLAVSEGCAWLVATLARSLTPLVRGTLGIATVLGLAMSIAGPLLLLESWRNNPPVERLYASALFDARWGKDSSDDAAHLEPSLRQLYPRLRAAYRAAYPAITTGKGGDASVTPLPGRPPNVVLIVTESLRHDVFGAELMPRLTRWAEGGLEATRHDSGTIYSESAMFSLLYGRSAALFHQTLDAGVPPQFCASLRSSGYECAYFTGHPKIWLRREEFLNERSMDHFVHDDRGSWPEWDRRALDGMVQMVNASEKPVFAIVLLMSSHFAYEYPPEFEIDRPVSDSNWGITRVSALGPDAEVPHRNRYRNCVRFIDDLVAGAIERIDPAQNLVIFTGDHGESINDDGHYTHGYTFADIVTRTPFAMVGPGVSPGRLDQPTSHVDVLPTVLHLLHGRPTAIAHVQGIDWLAGERHAALLEAHSPPGGRTIEAQLRTAHRRIRLDLHLDHPDLTLLGFEDDLAHLLPTPELAESEVTEISGAFEDQLSLLRR